jgi:hypothetical protein
MISPPRLPASRRSPQVHGPRQRADVRECTQFVSSRQNVAQAVCAMLRNRVAQRDFGKSAISSQAQRAYEGPMLRPLRPDRSLLALFGLCALLAGCGEAKQAPHSVDDGSCTPWGPSGEAGSSLAATRPAVLEWSGASAESTFVYALGTWLESGALRKALIRSSDLGKSFCVLPMPEPPTQVAPSPASTNVLYAQTSSDVRVAPNLRTSSDGGVTWTLASSPDMGAAYSSKA